MRAWILSKFDNLSLVMLIFFMVGLLVYVDRHGNVDFEHWLEATTAGVVGCYLGLIKGSREKWPTKESDNPATSIGIVAAKPNGGTNAK